MADIAELAVVVTDRGVTETDRKLQGLQRTGDQTKGTLKDIEPASMGASASLAAVGVAAGSAALALGVVFRVMREGVAEAAAAQRIQAALVGQLQIQGRASQELVTQLNAQAAALEQLSTQSDDAITSAQALLATFPAISDDALPRATAAAIDLAVAMGTDLRSAAFALGNALDNPEEGLTRLSRLGIRFRDDQKELIKSLSETGRAGEAAGVVLAEIEKRIGGRAAQDARTLAGSFDQLSVAWRNVLEEIGRPATDTPEVTLLVEDVTAAVRQLTEHIREFNQRHAGEFRAVVIEGRQAVNDLTASSANFGGVADGAFSGAATGVRLMLSQVTDVTGALRSLSEVWQEVRAFWNTDFASGPKAPSLITIGTEVTRTDRETTDLFNEARRGLGPNPSEFAQQQALAAARATIRERRRIAAQTGRPIFGPETEQLPADLPASPFFPPNTGPLISSELLAQRQERDAQARTREQEREKDRAEREAERAADLAAQAAERSRIAFPQAAETRADTSVAAAQAGLDVFRQQLELSMQLAATEEERARIVLDSAQQQLALAGQLDAAERARIEAQIGVLQAKAEAAGITAGERAELDAQIDQLTQQRDILAASGGEARKVRDEITRTSAELTKSTREQAQAIIDQVKPYEAIRREIEKIRTLATQPGGEGLTEDVLTAYEEQLREGVDGTKDRFDELLNATEGFGRSFSRKLAEALSGAKIEWKGFWRDLLTDISEMFIQRGLTDPIMGFFQGAVLNPLSEQFGGGKSGLDLGREFGASLVGGGGRAAARALFSPDTADPFGRSFVPLPSPGERSGSGGFMNFLPQVPSAALDALKRDDEGNIDFEGIGEDFDQLIADLQGGFSKFFGELSSSLMSVFESLFGEGGFDVAGFFTSIIGGAVKGAAGAAAGGGQGELVGPPQADGSFHAGGLVRDILREQARYHTGGLAGERRSPFGAGLRPGEVPLIAEEGELIIDKATTAHIRDLFGRGPMRRFHTGGLVTPGDDGRGRAMIESVRDAVSARPAGMPTEAVAALRTSAGSASERRLVVNTPVTIHMPITANDARSFAQSLAEHQRQIENMVSDGISRARQLSIEVGQRGSY